MKRIAFATAALCALSFTTAHAQTGAYEIVHAGDGAMTCDAIVKEAAALNAEAVQIKAAAEQQHAAALRTAETKRQVAGVGMSLLGRAAVMGMGHLPMGGLISNPQLMSGLMNAATAGGQAMANAAGGPAQAGVVAASGPLGQEQRAAYLMSLFKSKSC